LSTEERPIDLLSKKVTEDFYAILVEMRSMAVDVGLGRE